MNNKDQSVEQIRKSLLEWNESNKTLGETALVTAIFENIISTSKYISNYSTWLTAGTSIATGILLTNIASITPVISIIGFKSCGFTLILSILFGTLSKYFSILCEVSEAQMESKTNKVGTALSEYFENAEEIENRFKELRILHSTDIDMNKVQDLVCAAYPIWSRWWLKWRMSKMNHKKTSGYEIPILHFHAQCSTLALQIILLFSSVFSAFYFANSA